MRQRKGRVNVFGMGLLVTIGILLAGCGEDFKKYKDLYEKAKPFEKMYKELEPKYRELEPKYKELQKVYIDVQTKYSDLLIKHENLQQAIENLNNQLSEKTKNMNTLQISYDNLDKKDKTLLAIYQELIFKEKMVRDAIFSEEISK